MFEDNFEEKSMKLPIFKSLLVLGTVFLVCSCSEDKKSPSEGGDVSFVPCENVWYLPAEGFVIFQNLDLTTRTYKVANIFGNQIGTATLVPGTNNIVIVKDLLGNKLIDQVDLNDPNKTKNMAGVPDACTMLPNYPAPDPSLSTCLNAWYLEADKKYLIFDDLSVTDDAGSPIGILAPNAINPLLWDIVEAATGSIIINQLDLSNLPSIKGDGVRYKITEPALHWKDATGDYVIYTSSVVTDPAGTPVGYFDFTTGAILNLNKNAALTTTDLTKLAQTSAILQINSKCVDYQPPVPSSSSKPVASSSSTTPPDPKSSTGTQVKSSSSQAKSSSSQVKSSSSAVQSSSSKAPTGGCPTIKTKGGASGSGFASRYWDCCMPSCAWAENSGGNPTKTCDSKGKNEFGNGAGSVCSGGGGATCTSQIPFTVEGCDEYGFAFAAVPASNGGQCGKCFQLTFTGEGHYNSTNENTKRLKSKGKKLIVMATNIGGDVQQGQFDILIPGGGVGMFNGCSQMGWGGQGEQYGGLLSDCEKESGYKASSYAKCLTDKCNKAFGNDTEAKKGCMFLVEWMESAGNPEHNYVEVECPEVLKAKY